MLLRLQSTPFHVRLSWLFPVVVVLFTLGAANHEPAARELFAHTALFDATLSTALLVWFFTPRGERKFSQSVTLALRGVLMAALAFPLLRQYLWLEALGFAVLGWHVLRGLRQPLPDGYAELDDLERLYAFFGRLLPSRRMAQFMVFDRMLFRHLLLRPHLPEGQHFHTRDGATTGAMLGMLLFLSAAEGLLVHVLLERWNAQVAWTLTGLSAVTALWLLAYGRALTTRPVTVGRRRLYLRSGLHWTGSTPLVNLVEARPYRKNEDADAHSITLGNQPNTTLIFNQPVHLHGPYWVQAETRKVALQVDDARAFSAALATAAQPS